MRELLIEGLSLWRDGNQAVVSVKTRGRWLRLVETDCRGMFFAEATGEDIAAAVLQITTVRRRQRRAIRPVGAGAAR